MGRFAGALVAGMLCLTVAACGGGDATNTAASTATTTTTPAGSSASPTATAPASGDASSADTWSQAQCTQLAAAMALAAGGAGPTVDGSDPSSMSDYLRTISAGAPADLKDDFTTVADGLQKFYDKLKAAGIDLTDPSTYSSPDAVATLSKAAEQLQSDVGDAATHIQDRFQEICGTGG